MNKKNNLSVEVSEEEMLQAEHELKIKLTPNGNGSFEAEFSVSGCPIPLGQALAEAILDIEGGEEFLEDLGAQIALEILIRKQGNPFMMKGWEA